MAVDQFELDLTVFTLATEADAVTLSHLHHTMGLIDEVHDPDPMSLGLCWILEDPKRFLALLAESGSSVGDFFTDHLDNPFISNVLYTPELLMASGETAEQRFTFIREIFLASQAPSPHWLQYAIDAGLSPMQLGKLVIEKLKKTDVDRESSLSCFVKHRFAASNGERASDRENSNKPTYWSVLTDPQLAEAAMIIVDKAPNIIFGGAAVNEELAFAEKLALRLDQTTVDHLLYLAAGRLTNLHSVSEETFGHLREHTQIRTVRSVELTTKWALYFSLKLHDHFGDSLLERITKVTVWDYLFWRELGQRSQFASLVHNQHRLATKIELLLRSKLKEAGWKFGVLKKLIRNKEKSLVAESGHREYPLSEYQKSFANNTSLSPRVNDVVVFWPADQSSTDEVRPLLVSRQ